MKIGVIIPWKESPSRIKPLSKVTEWYKNNLPEAEIFFANASNDVWLPSASRNLGVRMAQEANCDIIVLNDADTIPTIKSLREAILAANNDDLIHMPYNIAKYLDSESSDLFYNGRPLQFCPTTDYPDACGGIWVCKPETWWSIGGMDEKFIQWGAEDNAMLHAHIIIKNSDFIRYDGIIYCLGHKKQEQDPNFGKSHGINSEIFRNYLFINNAEDMLTWVKAPMPKRF